MKRLEFNSYIELKEYTEEHYEEYDPGDIVVVHNARFLKTDKPHDVKLKIAKVRGKYGYGEKPSNDRWKKL